MPCLKTDDYIFIQLQTHADSDLTNTVTQDITKMSLKSTEVFNKFVEMKMRVWFEMNNMKKDGFIGKSDLRENADLFSKEFQLDEAKAKALENWLVNGWNILVLEGEKAAKSGDPPGITRQNAPKLFEVNDILENGERISEDQYVAAFGEIIEINRDLFVYVFGKMVTAFFDTFDTNHDGYIDTEGMMRGLRCFGIERGDIIRKIFGAMDTANTGLIDKSTYVKHWIEFTTGNDREAPIARYLLSPRN